MTRQARCALPRCSLVFRYFVIFCPLFSRRPLFSCGPFFYRNPLFCWRRCSGTADRSHRGAAELLEAATYRATQYSSVLPTFPSRQPPTQKTSYLCKPWTSETATRMISRTL